MFKSGFANIIGMPNAGKSTLMNLLTGEKLSAVTPKVQTTRKRILGIVNEKDYQLIFSDNPGIIDNPAYKLHEWMNKQVGIALQDADVILYIATPDEKINPDHLVLSHLKKLPVPVIVFINKTDTASEEEIKSAIQYWQTLLPGKIILHGSALKGKNTQQLKEKVLELLPEHPPYFDTDELTDRTERFLVAEMIREHIFLLYQQEIPYSVEVNVDEYRDKGEIIKIRAFIFVGRESHKMIILGKNGSAIKQLGIDSRKSIEQFAGKKVFLELVVKVRENWKNDERYLNEFGYQ